MVRKQTSASTPRLLTEVELELMTIVWRIGPCVVRDVLSALPPGRDIAYTSVAKILKILEDKGALRSEKGEKTHLYHAVLTREVYEERALKHVAEKLFDGSPSAMVMKLLDENEMTTEELEAIRRNLEERLRS